MRKTKKWGILTVSVFTFSVILGFVLLQNNNASDPKISKQPADKNAVTKTTGSSQKTPVANSVSSIDVLGFHSKLGPLPNSLDGTIMANVLVVDEDGNLRISSDIQRIFDYFLSTANEEPLETVLARINEYLEHYLRNPALNQAKDILVDYIDLKTALYDFEVERADEIKQYMQSDQNKLENNKLSYLEDQLQARNELREKHLSQEVYESFYEDEQIFDQYTLDRMKVMADKSLSEGEQQQQLDLIDSQAPKDLVQAREETQISDTLKKRTAKLREQGADDTEIRALRTEMFGEEAAYRFDELDRQRAKWKQRLNQYLAQRRQILTIQGLSLKAKEIQIDTLRSSLFDSREQIRVKVYERKSDA
ncbi:MAG: lipase chaperone LimK [Pseudohongiellaceae bacterium]|jgi:lipase chaperone LimK